MKSVEGLFYRTDLSECDIKEKYPAEAEDTIHACNLSEDNTAEPKNFDLSSAAASNVAAEF